jgi:hypothetical protein
MTVILELDILSQVKAELSITRSCNTPVSYVGANPSQVLYFRVLYFSWRKTQSDAAMNAEAPKIRGTHARAF